MLTFKSANTLKLTIVLICIIRVVDNQLLRHLNSITQHHIAISLLGRRGAKLMIIPEKKAGKTLETNRKKRKLFPEKSGIFQVLRSDFRILTFTPRHFS